MTIQQYQKVLTKYQELLAICEKVSTYQKSLPEDNAVFVTVEDSGFAWFYEDSELQGELDEWLCSNFINSNGQYTNLWYSIKNLAEQKRRTYEHTMRFWTGERDSFGPLISCIGYDNWAYSFG